MRNVRCRRLSPFDSRHHRPLVFVSRPPPSPVVPPLAHPSPEPTPPLRLVVRLEPFRKLLDPVTGDSALILRSDEHESTEMCPHVMVLPFWMELLPESSKF